MAKQDTKRVSLFPSKSQSKAENRKPIEKGKDRAKNFSQEQQALSNIPTKQKSTQKSQEVSEEWSWQSLADAHPSSQPAIFTHDAKYFLIAVSNVVKIYSMLTGLVVSTVSSSNPSSQNTTTYQGHTDRITGLCLNPESQFQLLTTSMDGTLKIWDILDGVLMRTIRFGQPATHLFLHPAHSGYVFVSCHKAKRHRKDPKKHFKNPEQSSLYRVSLNMSSKYDRSFAGVCPDTTSYVKTRRSVGMAVTPSGRFIVVAGGNKVYIVDTEQASEDQTKHRSSYTKLRSPEQLTCLAMHPTEDYFATGDTKGQIRIWHCLRDGDLLKSHKHDAKRAQTTTLHWHAHAVQSLAFTPNGAYLLSGGEESVLVIWQLHTGKKEFVPRLGAPIQSISINTSSDFDSSQRQQEYLLGLQDGTLAFVKADTLKVHRTIARVKLNSLPSSTLPPLAYHSQTNTLLLPSSHTSSLQIFSPSSSRLLSELEIAPTNRVSRRDEKSIVHASVQLVTTSDDGIWMATVDKREDEEDRAFGVEVSLKVWKWERLEGKIGTGWILNSRINNPHGSKKVNSLVFCPGNVETTESKPPLLLSTGDDGNVKTWTLRQTKDKKGNVDAWWVNRSSFTFRNQTPKQAAWSPEGSIMAVCHGSQLTLWDSSSNGVQSILSSPDIEDLTMVAFLGETGRFVCCGNDRKVIVWDLISCKVLKSHTPLDSYKISHILPARTTDSVILVSSSPDHPDTKITILTSSSSSSAPPKERIVPFQFMQCIPTPALRSKGQGLVGITTQGNLIECGDAIVFDVAGRGGESPVSLSQNETITRRTLWQDAFGQSSLINLDQAQSTKPNQAHENRARQGLPVSKENAPVSTQLLVDGGPSHLLPGISTIFSSLLDDMLNQSIPKQHETQDNPLEESREEGDVEMADVQIDTRNGKGVFTLDETEVKALKELFNRSEFKAPSKSSPALNGKSSNGPTSTPSTARYTNGTPLLNGTTMKSSKKSGLASLAFHQDELLSPSAESPSTKAKRKKSKILT